MKKISARVILMIMIVSMAFSPLALALQDESLEDQYIANDVLIYGGEECVEQPNLGGLFGNDNLEKILNFLVGKGLSLGQAAGIAGNIDIESGFDPAANNPNDLGARSRGLFQWRAGRGEALEEFAKKRKVGWEDLGAQLDYFWYESNEGGESDAFKRTLSEGGNDPQNVAALFDRYWERSDGGAREARKKSAENIFKQFAGKIGSTTGKTTGAGTISKSVDLKNIAITGIGDSLMVGAKSGFESNFKSLDGKWEVGISFSKGVDYAKSLGGVNDHVFLILGTNGGMKDESKFDEMMKALGTKPKVFLANIYLPSTYTYTDETNRFYSQMEGKYSNLRVIDWHSYAKNNPGSLSSDGYHPSSTGYEALVKLFTDAVKSDSVSNQVANFCAPEARTGCAGAEMSYDEFEKNKTVPAGRFLVYRQDDKRWGNKTYRGSGTNENTHKGYTYAQAACGMFSNIMATTCLTGKTFTEDEIKEINLKAQTAGNVIIKAGSNRVAMARLMAQYYDIKVGKDIVFEKGQTAKVIQEVNQVFKTESNAFIITGGSGQLPGSLNGHIFGIRGVTSDGKWLLAQSASNHGMLSNLYLGRGIDIDSNILIEESQEADRKDREGWNPEDVLASVIDGETENTLTVLTAK